MQPSATALAESHQQQARQRQQQRQADEQQQVAQEGTHSDSAASTAAASSAAVSLLSHAQRCHMDGLHSIFQYLTLRELLPALLTCRQWCAAAYKEKSRAVRIDSTPTNIALISASPLVYHVATCCVSSESGHDLWLAHLQLLSQWPRLTSLHTHAGWAHMLEGLSRDHTSYPAAVEELRRVFPRQLHGLSMWSEREAAAALPSLAAQQLLIDVVGGCTQLRQFDMDICKRESAIGAPCLLPLQHVTALGLYRIALTPAVVRDLRQLRNLEVLNINGGSDWTPKLLAELCAAPVTLRKLRRLELPYFLSATHMRELTRLPALDTLNATFRLDALPLLKEFPNLATLHLYIEEAAADLFPATLIVPHLAGCSGLTDLTLSHCSFREEDMEALVAAAPVLSSLKLISCRHLPSLSPLSAALHLRSLVLTFCAGFDMGGLITISVPSLRTLNIHLEWGSRVTESDRASLLTAMQWALDNEAQFAALDKLSSNIS